MVAGAGTEGIETSRLEITGATAPELVPRPSCAGTWFYAQPKDEPPSALYLPEYIEAVIVEEAGTLQGRYRARYKVADRAIPPEVRFQFRGPVDSEAPRLEWTGQDGSRGEVRLKLLLQNSLELGWTASRLGTSLGLGSGAAVLTRQKEP